MSWYNSNWQYRLPISVNNLGGASTIDVNVIPTGDVELFWSKVASTGYDVRFTASDGASPLAYNRASWTHATRSASFNVDAVSAASSDATVVIFMYFGYSAASDGSTSVTIASPKTGSIEVASPGTPRVNLVPFRAGETLAQQKVTKAAAEQIDVWIDCRKALQSRSDAYSNSQRFEEIGYIQVAVEEGGTDDAGRYDEALTTISDPGWVKVRVKGGSSGTDYTLIVTVGTSSTRVLEARAVVDVQDIDES